jgi:hypothetical protein
MFVIPSTVKSAGHLVLYIFTVFPRAKVADKFFDPSHRITSLQCNTPEGLFLANDQPPICVSVQTVGSGVGWP